MYKPEAVQDPDRLAALRRTGLLDTPPEEAFDRLTELAAKLIGAPAAFVSLVDDHRQFFKSSFGSITPDAEPATETPLDASFCQFTMAQQTPLTIEDARTDPLVAGNTAVDAGVISYAGVPLMTSDGHALGALCVVDAKPRKWQPEDIANLQALAASVEALITYRQKALGDESSHSSVPGASIRNVVRAHLEALNRYDFHVGAGASDESFIDEEAALRDAVTRTRDEVAKAVASITPTVDLTVLERELVNAVVLYLQAVQKRAAISAQFAQMKAVLSDVEAQVNETMHAEQRLRLAALKTGTD
jgi:signal transduction protein with GAF and PtsI domain